MADALTPLVDKLTIGAGSETGWQPNGWLPPDTAQYTSTLVSGIAAIEEYKQLPQKMLGGASGVVAGWTQGIDIPKWATDIAATGGLWLPMALESTSLVAAVEAVTNKAFAEVAKGAKELGKFGDIASLAKSGVAIAGDVISLVEKLKRDLSVETIVQSVADLINNVASVVADVGKALNWAKDLVADAFAAIPFCGMVASVLAQGIALLIQYGNFLPYSRESTEAGIRKADDEAAKLILDRCKAIITQDTRPVGTSFDSSKQQINAGPADLFRPISYWMFRCAQAYSEGLGSYRNPFGGRGLFNEPRYPAPPMTPVYFYVALCGDVLPPMLRPTTCGVANYRRGWLEFRRERDPFDCYTATVTRLRAKYGPNFGIPLATRKLMWKLVQGILGCVKNPMIGGFAASAKDDGKTLYSTLQQICYNEYLAGRINEELLEALNFDLTARHGWTENEGFFPYNHEGLPYFGRATCRDAGIRIDRQFFDELQKFSISTLNATIETKEGKKNFYSAGKWQFDQRLMAEARGKNVKGTLVVRPMAAQVIVKSFGKIASMKGLGDAMGPEMRDRFADGPMPWTAMLGADNRNVDSWMYLRSRARKGG